jgi:predicted permease
MNELRFALRTLRNNPGFALVAILSLALGTGANTAIFSLIDAVMLRMLPVSHPEELIFVGTNAVQMGAVRLSESITVSSLEYLQRETKSLASIGAVVSQAETAITMAGQTERSTVNAVSPNYFSALGVNAFLGRVLEPGDGKPGGRVALLSYAYWQRRFGGDPGILGRTIAINTVPFTIAGVTPREFYGISARTPADVMIPAATLPQVDAAAISAEFPKPDKAAGTVIGRLKPGVSLAQAEAELTTLLRQALTQNAGISPARIQAITKISVEAKPASEALQSLRNQFSAPLEVLMTVVAIVLLIACANIANLLLAKAAGRQREIAIRMSLGSSRGRVVRQLLTESLLLAAAGGALGLLFAIWARDALIAAVGVADAALAWNYRVIAFTAATCLASAVIFGTMPALRATALDFATAFKGASGARGSGRFTVGRALVAAQVALSLALLMGAGLFLNTFRNLDRIDIGYARKDALLVTVDPQVAGYRGARLAELYREVLDEVAKIPGVRSVSRMRDRLMTGRLMMDSVFVPGYTPKSGEDINRMFVIANSVGPHFIATSGMRLLAGRDFAESDDLRSPKVAVINETMAHHFFEGGNAVGHQFANGPGEPLVEIIGIVGDLKYFAVREGKQDVMFLPALQGSDASSRATLVLRTSIEPSRIASAVRAAIRAIDASIPVYDLITVDQQVDKTLSLQRLLAWLSIFFGGLALLLAAIGLYGVLSYTVAQRTGEIGIRMALGAQPRTVLRMILGETARLIVAGVALGVVLALAGARLVKSMLFGVSDTDPASLAAAAAILLTFAFVAACLPARRASRVDPMVALRNE